jgi:hypothetical protein
MPIIGQISVGDGATFTPAVDSDGVISWTNNKNLPNPASVDLPQAVIDRYQLAPTSNPTFTGTVTAEDITASGTITGNVTGTASGNLPLSGGTMTGAIDFSSAGNNIKATNDDGYLVFRGGDADTSASIVLRGNNYTQYNNPGSFSIRATDGNTYTNLDGKPDGTLTWDGKSITERSFGTVIQGNGTYTFTCNENGAVIFAKRGTACAVHMVSYWDAGSVKIFETGSPITITKSANNKEVTITNNSTIGMVIKILNGGSL